MQYNGQLRALVALPLAGRQSGQLSKRHLHICAADSPEQLTANCNTAVFHNAQQSWATLWETDATSWYVGGPKYQEVAPNYNAYYIT
jgi:hypothetical protein